MVVGWTEELCAGHLLPSLLWDFINRLLGDVVHFCLLIIEISTGGSYIVIKTPKLLSSHGYIWSN